MMRQLTVGGRDIHLVGFFPRYAASTSLTKVGVNSLEKLCKHQQMMERLFPIWYGSISTQRFSHSTFGMYLETIKIKLAEQD